MLSHRFSFTSHLTLANQKNTLAVIPLANICSPSEHGIIFSGIEHARHDGTNGVNQSKTLLNEVWSVNQSVTRGESEGCHWSKTKDIICVAHWLTQDDCKEIEKSTYTAYRTIFSVLHSHGFPHPFRFWNYLPNINLGEGDDEVYRKFCTGRLKAFESLAIEPMDFPAASALGHHSQGGVIYVLASASTAMHFNNNKQINAYDYPSKYGPSSPSFARATALNLADNSYLFISGTASIIGHKTVEVGDLIRQLEVTTDNIEHLLLSANPDKKSLATFKVYVRHTHHVQQTKDWLIEHYPNVDTVITLADVCRDNLLVEIECFCQ